MQREIWAFWGKWKYQQTTSEVGTTKSDPQFINFLFVRKFIYKKKKDSQIQNKVDATADTAVFLPFYPRAMRTNHKACSCSGRPRERACGPFLQFYPITHPENTTPRGLVTLNVLGRNRLNSRNTPLRTSGIPLPFDHALMTKELTYP